MKKLILGIIALISFYSAQAVTRTWVGTTTAFATSGNWNPSGVPSSSDDLIFNNSNNCLISANVNVNSISIASSYTGAITRSGTRTVTVNILSINGSSMSLVSGSGAVTINNLVVTGGTLNLGNSSTTINSVTVTGGTLTIPASDVTFNSLVLISGGTFSLTNTSSTVNVNGSFFANAGIVTTSSAGVIFQGENTTIAGSLTFNNITFASDGLSDKSFYISGSLSSTTLIYFDPNSTNINFYRDPIYIQGDFNAFNTAFVNPGGTVTSNNLLVFNGSAIQTVNLTSDQSIGNFFNTAGGIQFNNTLGGILLASPIDGTNVIGGGITIVGGSLTDNGFDITLPSNQNFQMNDGTTFTSSSASLPSFSGSGTFVNPSIYTISLTGSFAQSISTPFTRLNNLLIDKPSGGDVSLTSPTSITGFLNLNINTSNKLNTNNNLTLVSTASQTASLIDNNNTIASGATSGSANGSLTVQRYAPGISVTVGHYFSSPIVDAAFSVISQPGFNTLLYSENGNPARINLNFSGGFRRVTESPSVPLMTPGRGFSTVQPITKVINFVGVPNNGNVPTAITFNTTVPGSVAGWNLIGNPYPSAIDWGRVGVAGVKPFGISTAYVYSIDGYKMKLDAAGSIIPSGQGFFVKATSSGTLTFKNTDRVSDITSTGNNTFAREEAARKYLYINLDSKVPGLASTDAAIFSFDANASDDFDNYDSEKIFNPSPLANIYTLASGRYIAVNLLNDVTRSKIIPLYVSVRTYGTYQIAMGDVNSFYPDVDVYLNDTENSNSPINLKSTPFYSFKYTTFTGSRFSLSLVSLGDVPQTSIPGVSTIVSDIAFEVLSRTFVTDQELAENAPSDTTDTNIISPVSDELFKIYSYGTKVFVRTPTGAVSVSEISLFDILGNKIIDIKNIPINNGLASFEAGREGIFIIKLNADNKMITKKLILY